MKIYQVLLLFILCCKTTAQENITVEYNQIFNTDFPTIGTGVLQIEKDNSIFVDMLKTYRDFKKVGDAEDSYLDFIKDNKTEIAQGEKIIISFGGNYDNYYFVNDLKNNTFHFTDELSKKLYLIKDDFKLNWKMTDETKIVSGKKTYKAETFFRGRK